jgi:hypothetical protein
MAITALVLGIASFPAICCYGVPAIALGVTALILGRRARGRIQASGGALAGEGLAQAGWICGLIGGSLGLVYFLFVVGAFILSIFIAGPPPGILPPPQ